VPQPLQALFTAVTAPRLATSSNPARQRHHRPEWVIIGVPFRIILDYHCDPLLSGLEKRSRRRDATGPGLSSGAGSMHASERRDAQSAPAAHTRMHSMKSAATAITNATEYGRSVHHLFGDGRGFRRGRRLLTMRANCYALCLRGACLQSLSRSRG
jgi:hypothetical protein